LQDDLCAVRESRRDRGARRRIVRSRLDQPARGYCARDNRHTGLHRSQGALRADRERRRQVRRRRECVAADHREARLIGVLARAAATRMDAATIAFPILIALIGTALVFDFLNGLHDAANSIATVVSTRVLRPPTAGVWAAFFNFIAFAVFGLHVARTLGTGIVETSVVDATVIFGALAGAIVWNIVTWALGLPSSSSHALIGGLVGAGLAKGGVAAIVFGGLVPTALGIVLSPLLGFVLAQLL